MWIFFKLQSHYGKEWLETAARPKLLQLCAINLQSLHLLNGHFKDRTKSQTTRSQLVSSALFYCHFIAILTQQSQSAINFWLNWDNLALKCNRFTIILQLTVKNLKSIAVCCKPVAIYRDSHWQKFPWTAYIQTPARTPWIWNRNSTNDDVVLLHNGAQDNLQSCVYIAM